jgi:hypothetical protein
MHEVDSFFAFAKGIFKGLVNAIKTDIDVFLLAFSAVLWPIKIFRGAFTSLLTYVIIRRVDGLMSAYVDLKKRELNNVTRP